MMHILLTVFILFIYSSIGAFGQDTVKLELGRKIEREITPEGKHIYLLDLDSSQFAYGELTQINLDVAISIFDAENNQIKKIDETGRYLELFHIESVKSGTYRIEVLPYMSGSGLYSIEIKNIESLAPTPEKQLDQIIKAYYRSDHPGGALSVLCGGKIVYTKAYGLANLTDGIPFTIETSSNIASTSKQFTGFAIALLEKEGKLSLEDEVHTYIPELPDYDHPVTLRNLLNHTSGFRGIWYTLLMQGYPDDLTREEIIRQIQRQSDLQNDPGTKFKYTNTNYILLAEVISNVSGVPFAEWMKVNVFDPLEMNNTIIKTTTGQIIPNSARGYRYLPEENQFIERVDLDAYYGASSIYTTVGDLSKWLCNFGDSHIGGPEVIDRMTECGVLIDGDTLDYALGLIVDKHRGLLRYYHTGGEGGQRSSLTYFPEIGAGIIFIGNGRIYDAINNKIIQIFIEEHLTPEEITESIERQEEEVAAITPQFPDAYLGRFGSDEANMVINFIREDNRLSVQFLGSGEQPSTIHLKSLSETIFMDANNNIKVSFHWDANGQVSRTTVWFRIWDAHATEFEFQRLPDYNPSEENLKIYIGLYYSAELETAYTIVIEDSKLTIKYHRLDDNKLTPKEQDHFSASYPLGDLFFERDDEGNISGFSTQNVYFEKLK